MKNHLFNMHHKIKLKLDAICQEEGDMNVEEFMQVYESLKQDRKVLKPKGLIVFPEFVEDGCGNDTFENMIEDPMDAWD